MEMIVRFHIRIERRKFQFSDLHSKDWECKICVKYGSFNVNSYSPLGHRCIHGQVHDVRHDPGRHQESQHLCQHDLHQFYVFENFTFGCSVEGVFWLNIELLDIKGFIFSRRSSVTNIDIKNAIIMLNIISSCKISFHYHHHFPPLPLPLRPLPRPRPLGFSRAGIGLLSSMCWGETA